MNFNIDQIIIMVDSNIPNPKTRKNKEPFELTNETFYHPVLTSRTKASLSKYPYFIAERKYPKGKLYILARESYEKIIRFFFDKEYFEKKLLGFFKSEPEPEVATELTPEQKKENFDETATYNVQVMIELLFPTTWPAVRNFTSSHSEYILGKKEQGISFKDTLYQKANFGFATQGSELTSGLFSYLKVEDKIYTVSRVVWLNDLLNHPVYRNFIDNFINHDFWIDTESTRLDGLLKKSEGKLLSRILDDGSENLDRKPRRDSLYIFDEKENFKSKNESETDTEESKPKESETRDYKKVQFYEDLHKLVNQLGSFQEAIKLQRGDLSAPDQSADVKETNINELFSLAKDLADSFDRLKKNDRVKLRGITDNFGIKLSKIVEEFRKLNVLEKIRINYMSAGEINTKLEGEDPDVVAELKKHFPRLVEFIEKSKYLLQPKRESSNIQLQEIIVDYSENNKQSNPRLEFTDLMLKIRGEMITLKSTPKTDDKDKERMRVGVNVIDKNKMGVPHYEIYLALDMMEGEINSNNLEGIKCKYRGLYLGRETENFFGKYNPFVVSQHRVYVPENDEVELEDIVLETDDKVDDRDKDKDRVDDKDKDKDKVDTKESKGGTRRRRRYRRERRTKKRPMV
jgi:hypothetical protein